MRKDLLGYLVYRRKGNGQSELINEAEYTHCSYYYDLGVEAGFLYSYSIAAVYADGSKSGKSPEGSMLIE